MSDERDHIIAGMSPWEVLAYAKIGGNIRPYVLEAAKSALAEQARPASPTPITIEPLPNEAPPAAETRGKRTRTNAGLSAEVVRAHRAKHGPMLPTPQPGEGLKFCAKCNRMKPVSWFSRDRGKADGRMHHCKSCCYFVKARKPSPEWTTV